MCLKYGMIILIIIIISLGQILLSYVSNTQKSNCSNHYTLQTHIWPVACSFNWILGGSVFAIGFGCFSSIKKLLGRNEMRTREGKDRQVIRRVKISSKTIEQDNFVTCSLRTATDRFKQNYCLDAGIHLERGFASMPRPPVKRHTIFCHACPSPALVSTACAIAINKKVNNKTEKTRGPACSVLISVPSVTCIIPYFCYESFI